MDRDYSRKIKKLRAALRFEADDVLERVRVKGDLWEDVLRMKQKLPKFA